MVSPLTVTVGGQPGKPYSIPGNPGPQPNFDVRNPVFEGVVPAG